MILRIQQVTTTKICITLRCKKKVMEKGKSMTIYTYPIVVALSPHRLVLKVNLSTSVTPALKFWLCLFLVLALFSSSETRSHKLLLNKSNRALWRLPMMRDISVKKQNTSTFRKQEQNTFV